MNIISSHVSYFTVLNPPGKIKEARSSFPRAQHSHFHLGKSKDEVLEVRPTIVYACTTVFDVIGYFGCLRVERSILKHLIFNTIVNVVC